MCSLDPIAIQYSDAIVLELVVRDPSGARGRLQRLGAPDEKGVAADSDPSDTAPAPSCPELAAELVAAIPIAAPHTASGVH